MQPVQTLCALRTLAPAGGAPRIREELCALVGSYDACQLPVGVLQSLAAAGFADVAAAVAARRVWSRGGHACRRVAASSRVCGIRTPGAAAAKRGYETRK